MSTSIGIRELRQNASKYIALVRQGQSIEITDRGQPVARLEPIAVKRESRIDELIRLGLATPAVCPGGVAGLKPRPLRPGQRPPSEILAEMRADERF